VGYNYGVRVLEHPAKTSSLERSDYDPNKIISEDGSFWKSI
jgi:hypothetical protein